MKLFFLRHGEAGVASTDDLRELTARGRTDVAQVVSAQRTALVEVAQVLVSPILRAQQTADIACVEAGLRAVPRHTVDWLVHETPVAIALAEVARLDRPTLLVGHQPLAGSLIQRLTGLYAAVGTANLLEMEGEAFLSGFMTLVKHSSP